MRTRSKLRTIMGPFQALILSALATFTVCQTSLGLEVFATLSPTDSSSKLNTTTNPLIMPTNSTATVYFWLSYTPTERTSINDSGGLYGGGFSIPFQDPTVATILNASDFQEAGVNWITFQPNVNSPGPRLGFTMEAQPSIVLPLDKTSILVASATITSSALGGGTTANLSSYGAYPWLDNNFTPYSTIYTPFAVPEPSTYALAATACVVAGLVARRKKA